ncbi:MULTISPECIES: YhcN/YlaJ family sporulation lipoprotein [Aneurinibacillus]|uniref:Sporulation lipoprotein YhcN/YlaJ (Spore_YhcN_YlaJ) n=1 Tax=Aneurinibacillus thermoaerophilus TaxID=143495 RepID=A0A1G8BZ79_ANETH|nr:MULTISPECIES: YhcN/YlaJ family sporulation lipoprotein [Aneurinibacillus]AMA71974.1 hypothetical protein ACH33_03365 [Aneurinibacillus sp. XH2]MED0675102.1 YhcN/YlaJ family sporulation lipoprotein [Aneurinibacillus thermoaerophilus]MED0679250.1 YhcN/YlaJ family sporulation lipoprotein [Aneurinibacillus thermoaerophilus]MED0737136.1 YhcN/YlaJ family sporulation lipoprotein [Aneurinibacillus thermoaerophilus]MED0757182.1 YhcN/YlaJ family sporulation lipoprotein [Aneurinibacillus thermoaerophi
MKKILSVLSVVGLAVSLAACSPAADNTRTNQYRPLSVGPNNPPGTIYRYHNVGDGRYDTYRNGIIKDQTNYRPGVLRDSRDRMLRTQGLNDMGINNNGQRVYSTGKYGTNTIVGNNAYPYSIYRPDTKNYNVGTRSNQPTIGFVHLGDNQAGNGRTYNGMGVQNYNAPNGNTLYQGIQANYDTATPNVYVDRQMLASAVAKVAKQIPGVKRATVLTTDNQIFVGCDTSGLSPSAAQTILEKVQKGCENVSPRYYKVYTTNDQNTIDKVYKNAMQMGTKTDQEFEQMIGHKANSMHNLSTNTESNKSSSSKSGKPMRTHHMKK